MDLYYQWIATIEFLQHMDIEFIQFQELKKLHSGLDIVGTWHTPILAVADGEITYAGTQNGYGNCIEIKHIVNGETVYSFYAHLSQINVKVGEKVSQGQIIGLEGGAESDPNHGTSTGHHLHFELRRQAVQVIA